MLSSDSYIKLQYQHSPIELSTMIEMVYICDVQCGSHQPHMDIEHLKYGSGEQGTQRLILFNLINLNFNSHIWLRNYFIG